MKRPTHRFKKHPKVLSFLPAALLISSQTQATESSKSPSFQIEQSLKLDALDWMRSEFSEIQTILDSDQSDTEKLQASEAWLSQNKDHLLAYWNQILTLAHELHPTDDAPEAQELNEITQELMQKIQFLDTPLTLDQQAQDFCEKLFELLSLKLFFIHKRNSHFFSPNKTYTDIDLQAIWTQIVHQNWQSWNLIDLKVQILTAEHELSSHFSQETAHVWTSTIEDLKKQDFYLQATRDFAVAVHKNSENPNDKDTVLENLKQRINLFMLAADQYLSPIANPDFDYAAHAQNQLIRAQSWAKPHIQKAAIALHKASIVLYNMTPKTNKEIKNLGWSVARFFHRSLTKLQAHIEKLTTPQPPKQ
jgi:hypothetical protein